MSTTSNNLIRVCKKSELPHGQSKSIQANGKEISIFNIKEKYFAIDNICIHAGAPLNEGSVDEEKCQVVCSWHAWTYDLSTSKCVSHPKQDVFTGTYSVKIENDEVFVQI